MSGTENVNTEKKAGNYVSDDHFYRNYAPMDEYIVFQPEKGLAHGDKPMDLTFFQPDPKQQKKFFHFLAKACLLVTAITIGVYWMEHEQGKNTFYTAATTSDAPSSMETNGDLPTRQESSLKNLTEGTIRNQMQRLNVRGVMVTASTAKALIGDRILHQGEHIIVGTQKLTFKGVSDEKMVFSSSDGRNYLLPLQKTSSLQAGHS
jgi:hypothetical protein